MNIIIASRHFFWYNSLFYFFFVIFASQVFVAIGYKCIGCVKN